ncbi:BAH domain protein, partial [Dictyocaulus viviparus]
KNFTNKASKASRRFSGWKFTTILFGFSCSIRWFFQCEFAGDVVSFEDAKQRWAIYSKSETSPIILCLTSRLFIDATIRGNVSRFVRQSCKPNARLEVWSVNGNYRAGLFSLGEIASGAEITIDMNGLLPVSKDCNCGVSGCRKRIVMARNSFIASAGDLSINEERAVRGDHIFLIRNRQRSILHAATYGLSGSFGQSRSQIDGMRKVLRGVAYSKAEIATNFDAEMGHWLDELADDDIERAYVALRERYISEGGKSEKDEKPKRDRRKENRFVNRDTNLEYIDSKFPVGGYDPDDAWPLGKANEKDDAVRCVCGSLEEDGEMIQCDTCNFWLHSECLSDVDQDNVSSLFVDSTVVSMCFIKSITFEIIGFFQEYKCQFCRGIISGGRPCVDVILAKQPDIRLRGCSYYKALVNNRGIQIRLNETVHVLKAIGDDVSDLQFYYVSILDLRVFRVERLFAATGGHRFVFGFYYARPHETFCDSQRIFHRNEVFATPLYDTLPLDAVVGRCAVLDPSIWCIGRPTVPKFKEADIYLCEYQIDRNQRSFEKIPMKNRYPINTQPYVFKRFEDPVTIKRDFTPFVVDQTISPSKLSFKMGKEPSHAVDAKRFMMQNLSAIVERLNDASKKEVQSRKEGE